MNSTVLVIFIFVTETCVIWAQLINSSVPEQYLNNVRYKTVESKYRSEKK